MRHLTRRGLKIPHKKIMFFFLLLKNLNVVLIHLALYKLILSQTSPGFYMSAGMSFGNIVTGGEIACNELFLLFPQCFLPFFENCPPLSSNLNHSCLQTLSVWKSLNFVVCVVWAWICLFHSFKFMLTYNLTQYLQKSIWRQSTGITV